MRELKFRVWGETEKEYIVYPFVWLGIFDNYDGLEIEPMEGLVIEQYTGLKDENGKEIYEGDIVKLPDCLSTAVYKVVTYNKAGFDPFQEGCFGCASPEGEEVEVVGNIHENPELLLEKEK